jgi:DNA processing protein
LTGPAYDPDGACFNCLKRSWLIARLGAFIQVACDDRAGRRTPELLRLSDEDLVAAVAPRRADELLCENAGLREGDLRSVLEEAGCWSRCSHGEGFPEGLEDGADAPCCLIGRGDSFALDEVTMAGSVTVVGARRATGYGLEVARMLGAELASAGLVVVSGLALGIDGAVHRGAVERGRTVAVLAGGPDRPYPVSHTRLYRAVLDRGLVISELPPGTRPWRWGFPARNRIMAALSRMTVVVEAAKRSGSLITAEMAADAGREVGAVPGPVTAGPSAGTNELIASGAALVRSGEDVVERLAGMGLGLSARLFGPGVDSTQMPVLEAVESGELLVDEIALAAGVGVADAAATLARLEVAGYVNCSLGGQYRRTGLASPGSGLAPEAGPDAGLGRQAGCDAGPGRQAGCDVGPERQAGP